MIGIVGFGRFGRLMTRYLSRDFEVRVWDVEDQADAVRESGGRPVSLPDTCCCEVLILAVPISALRALLVDIAPRLAAGTLVVDVCSVKAYPVRWMRDCLPGHVSILATHPMFGPDSAAESLRGCKVAVCPERIDPRRLQNIKAYLEGRGLTVIETTPAEHDRQIAVSLALTHFIGRSLSEFGAEDKLIDTEGYRRLLHILEVVENDTWQLFEDMHRYNPYAGQERRAFISAMQSIAARLEEGAPPPGEASLQVRG
jgi:prephenate dehydrogenase